MADNPENEEYWHCNNYKNCGSNWVGSNNLCQSCSTPENSIAPSDSITENTDRTVKRLKSIVWEHFIVSETEPKKAICKHCPRHKNTFAYTNGGTKNLNNHLNSQHKAILNKDLKVENPITEYFKSKNLFSKALFEERLVKWIVKDDQSFQVVENESFKDMMSLVRPGLSIPSRNTVKRRVMDEFQDKKVEMIDFFDKLDSKVSFTTDCWTSPNSIAFMGITAHFIDTDWNVCAMTLDFLPIPSKHTGDCLAESFLSTLKTFKLENKTLAITLDNASNNDTFIRALDLDKENSFQSFHHIRCFAHVLNLGAQDALAVIEVELKVVRKIIKKIRSSPQMTKKFEAIQEHSGLLNPIALILDCKTRWNSTATMLQRILRLKQPVINFLLIHGKDLTKPGEDLLTITSGAWNRFSEIMTFLKPFNEATIMTSADKYPTLSVVVPLYNAILDHMNLWMTLYTTPGDVLHSAVIAAYAKIKVYYDLSSDCYTIATVLDPRFNIIFYDREGEEDQDSAEAIVQVVKRVYENFYQEKINVSNPTPHPPRSMFSHLYSKTKVVPKDELQSYLTEPALGEVSSSDMLLWWKSNSRKYPTLSRMAQHYLSIPGTSASSERLFSSGKELITDRRNRLNEISIQAVQCLKTWSK